MLVCLHALWPQTTRAVLLAAIFLACSTCCISTAAQSEYSGFAVLPYNVTYALDMVCPNAGDVLGDVAINAVATNQGATFASSWGSSLPLPPAVSGQSVNRIGVPSSTSEYYFTIRCETSAGCAINWDVLYYCKATTGTYIRAAAAHSLAL